MEIFIKPSKKVSLTHRSTVHLKDVAEICVAGGNERDIKDIVLLNIDFDKSSQYMISAIDIIKKVAEVFPDANIQCLGETETLIDYTSDPEKTGRAIEKLKTAFVCIVLFGGAMTAIMSFHSDAQMPAVFQNMYRIFFGVEATKPYIIYIPYSIGLAVGIIVFFNHFGMKKITSDPTPIEVEMTTYEKESADSILDRLDKEKSQKSTERSDTDNGSD